MPVESLFEKTPFPDPHFLCNFFHLQATYGTFTPPHWHEHIEFVRVEKGRANIKIDSDLFETNEGEIMMVGRQQIHFYYNDTRVPSKVSCLVFNPNIILSPLGGDVEKHMIIPLIAHSNHVNRIIKKSPLRNCIYEKLEEISDLFQKASPGFELYVKSIILQIFSELYFYSQPQINELSKHSLDHHNIGRFDELFYFLRNNYNKPITTKKAADISNMSNTHFCHVFKRHMGMSFKKYLMLIRSNIAEGLLRETDESIGNIAEQVGFSDINYFSRTFKKIHGVSPSRIRNQGSTDSKDKIPVPWEELI